MCFAPKINHLLRTVTPYAIVETAAEHNDVVWATFNKIFQLQTKTRERPARMQSGLGPSDGGMGLCYASDVKEAAFVASAAAVLPKICEIGLRTRHPVLGQPAGEEGPPVPLWSAYVETASRLTEMVRDTTQAERLSTTKEMLAQARTSNLQRKLSEVVSRLRRERWIDEASTLKDKSRFDSASGKEAGAWVTAVLKHRSTTAEPKIFRTTV